MMNSKTLEELSSWLRCYPVAGREEERKRLTDIVEAELRQVVQEERSKRIRAGLSLDGLVEIPEWMGKDAYTHECPVCLSLFNIHKPGCIRREPPPLPSET